MSRRRSDSSPLGPIAAAIVGSVLLHLLMWPVGDRVIGTGRDRPLPPEPDVIEIDLQPTLEDEPDPDAVKMPGELVKLDSVDNERRPEDAKRISEFDNDVERETVARGRRQPASPPRGAKSPSEVEPKEGGSTDQPRGTPLPLGGRDAVGESRPKTPVSPPSPRAGLGSGTGSALSPRVPRGVPDSVREQWGQQGGYDRADDVEQGAQTLLDTERWKYASFFNRLRDDIAQYWDPVALLRVRDPDGRKLGSKTRTTRLKIILESDGSLHKVKLDRSCGVDFLDEEAIRSVRSAAPFPNPPPEMLESDGKLHVPFGFIVEMDGKGRIHRYRR